MAIDPSSRFAPIAKPDDWMWRELSPTGLSTRAWNSIVNACHGWFDHRKTDRRTPGSLFDLSLWTIKDLKTIKNCGIQTAAEIYLYCQSCKDVEYREEFEVDLWV